MDGIFWFTIAAVAGLTFTLTLAVYRTLTSTSDQQKFDETLAIIQSSELEDFETDAEIEEHEEAKSFSWNRYWLKIARQAGRVPDDPASPGRFALGAFVVGTIFGVFVFPGGILGIFAGAGVLGLGQFWLQYEANKRKLVMEAQMPILLSSLRSQMHAGVTVQSALMNIADDIPSPLGDEVRMVRRDVNVSISLDEALNALAKRVKSRQMQFLVASIGIAVKSGSDLVPQLVTIEEIVQQRARIDGKIRSAVALAKPTAILAAIAPPGMLLYFSISDPNYLPYFFGPGIIIFGIAVGLYVLGLFIVRAMIKNVENT
jgi:Flp pilus assembly protein TadB